MSPKIMLERQNAELVSLISISGEEFVYVKQQQPEKKSSKKKKKTQFDLDVQVWVNRALSDHSVRNWDSYQITKQSVYKISSLLS